MRNLGGLLLGVPYTNPTILGVVVGPGFLNQVPTLLQYPYRSLIVSLIDPFKGTLCSYITKEDPGSPTKRSPCVLNNTKPASRLDEDNVAEDSRPR